MVPSVRYHLEQANCQPESVKDRPTRAHEYVFLFSNRKHYFYQADAIKEPATSPNGTVASETAVPCGASTRRLSLKRIRNIPAQLGPSSDPGRNRSHRLCSRSLSGSGTVGQVALEEDRRFVGIEIKPEYAELAVRRLGW